jgi:hypothetical protein
MVKRLLLLSLMVLAICGASSAISQAGGPPAGPCVMPPPGPPCPPPICGPAKTTYSQVKEQIAPVPAQLRTVRVVAPYLAGIAWPRTPLPFFGNPQTFPNPLALGRYEWLVPVVEIRKEHNWTYRDLCCKEVKVPRCVYVKANYVGVRPACGPVPMGAPAPMPMMPTKVMK